MAKTAEQLRENFKKRHGHLPGEAKPVAPPPLTPEQQRAFNEATAPQDKAATTATSPAYSGKGYMELVEEYRDRKGGTLVDAMIAVSRKHPEARADYIKKMNPHLA